MTQAKPTAAPARSRKPRRAPAIKMAAFKAAPRVQHALAALSAQGVLGNGGSKKVSARLDPGLLEAARAKIGVDNDTDLITAALAIAAGDDGFGAWLVTRGPRLPADFELEF
jgi:hypothetical protein